MQVGPVPAIGERVIAHPVDNRRAGRSRLWIALVNAEFFQQLALKELRVNGEVNGQPSQPQTSARPLAYQEAAEVSVSDAT